MRNIIYILFFITNTCWSQVGIGTTSINDDVMLDISSSNGGLLIPRMTISQRNAIVNPTEGLLVYVLDTDDAFCFFNGFTWISLNKDYVFRHYIGEFYQGGIIAALWKEAGVEHGLIISQNHFFGNFSNIQNVNAGTNFSNDALTNSNLIVSLSGHTNSAAKVCLDLVENGYSDWYLPSVREMKMIRENIYTIQKSLQDRSFTQFSLLPYYQWYHTCLEQSATNYYIQDMILGTITFTGKAASNYIRPIRKF